MKKKAPEDNRPLTDAASHLEDEIDEMETLARRAAKVELASHAEILRAADLLKSSLEVHTKFVERFTELTAAVNAIRDRQNRAVAALQDVSDALDERRKAWQALEQRFGQLGEAAHEINALMRVETTESDPTLTIQRASAVIGRLSAAVEEAKAISVDAREAGFAELQQQADSMHQQLRALVSKLEEATRVMN